MSEVDFSNSLNMLHLSDLHLADKNLGKIDDNLKALKNDLAELKQLFNWSPDLVFFTGDAVFDGGDAGSIENFFNEIVIDIISALGLNRDRFIICPGNHEIDRGCFDEERAAGIRLLNNDVDKLNSYQQKIGFCCDDKYCTLTKFFQLRDEFYAKTTLSEFKGQIAFYNDYDIKGRSVSVSSLCSSWIAYGGAEDEGKMLIGKKQYDEYVKKCSGNVKIVLAHHPLSWLADFDKKYIQGELLWDKAIYLFGHMHEHDSSKFSSPQGSCLNLQSGALCNDDYVGSYHGYTALALENNSLNCIHRKYFETRKSFDSNNSMGKSGIWTVDTGVSNDDCSLKIRELDSLELNYPALVSEISDFAPQRVEDIYVFPEIRSVTPSLMRAKPLAKAGGEDKCYTEEDILNSDDNYMVVGKQNSGKTSLLSYLQYRFNMARKMAFYIDINALPKDKEKIVKSISYLVGKNKNETKQLLKSSNAVLLLDNFTFSKRVIEELVKIRKDFGVRVIVSLQEDYEKALDELAKRISSFNFVKIYIYPFKACHVRSLVDKWFVQKEGDTDSIVKKIAEFSANLDLHMTPYVLSLCLYVFESQPDYIPANEASLLEKFVETLLKKDHDDLSSGGLADYRLREGFLSDFAGEMYLQGKMSLKVSDFMKQIEDYFEDRSQPVSGPSFYNYLKSSKLIGEKGNEVYLFLKCFYDYFLAKKASSDPDLLQRIQTVPEVDIAPKAIQLVAGFDREYEAEELLNNLLELLAGEYDEQIVPILSKGKKMVFTRSKSRCRQIDFNTVDKADEEVLEPEIVSADEASENSEMDDLMIDTLLSEDNSNYALEQSSEGFTQEDAAIHFQIVLDTAANVLKNTDLLPKETLKIEAFKKILSYNMAMIDVMSIQFGELLPKLPEIIEKIKNEADDEQMRELASSEDFWDKILSDLEYFSLVFMPVIRTDMFFQSINSKKLEKVLDKINASELKDDYEVFALLFVLHGISPNNAKYINQLSSFVDDLANDHLIEIMFHKIGVVCMLYKDKYTRANKERMVKIQVNLMMRIVSNKFSSQQEITIYKDNLYKSLKKMYY